MAILSMNRESEVVIVGVEESLRNFSKGVYEYSLITVITFIVLYSSFNTMLRNILRRIRMVPELFKIFVKALKSSAWKSLFMLINRENLTPRTRHAAVLYICFSFFGFSLVNSFFGLMSADLVKQIDQPVIDSMKDLLYHEDFQHLEVITAKGAWQEQGFLATLEGSDERKLWERKGSKFAISLQNFGYLFQVIRQVLRNVRLRKAVFIFDTLPMNIFISVGCQASVEQFGPYLHLSGEKFIPGNLMLGYNPNIRLELKNYFDHSYQRIQESGWIGHFFSSLGYKINFGKIGEFEIYKCIQRIREKEKIIPPPFDVRYMSKPFIATIIMMSIALVILILEHALFKFNRMMKLGMKKCKKQNVRKKQSSINKFGNDHLVGQSCISHRRSLTH